MARAFNNIPTVFVAFGATGDLMRLKVVPALYHLYRKKELPDHFAVIGFGRRAWSDAEFQAHVRTILEAHGTHGEDEAFVQSFISLFSFQEGYAEKPESYAALKKLFDALDAQWKVCANKLFYLAVSPELYEPICTNLAKSHLTDPCSPEEGWTRVIVEKPFGTDYVSARKLDELLATLFKEEQIYRIDHYLAKEMLQNILVFRFSNNLFELNWDKDFIERIEMRLLEEVGVEKRGAFYDGVGALRDVGQNHLLQMLALITMEHPRSFAADDIRNSRAEVLDRLIVPTREAIAKNTFRAQYNGYRAIPGVTADSNTETYFSVRAELTGDRWSGVPMYLEAGKRLGDPLKEIRILFKHPKPCLCPEGGPHHRNEVVIRMEPKEEIVIEYWTKKPGLTYATEERMFHFLLREKTARVQYTEEYERLLLDCIRGDQTLFISTQEIRAMWRFTDPIVAAWNKDAVPLHQYEPGGKNITGVAKTMRTERSV